MIDISKYELIDRKTIGVFRKKWILYKNTNWLVKYNYVTKEWIENKYKKISFQYLHARLTNSKFYVRNIYEKKLNAVDKEIIGIHIAKNMGLNAVEAFKAKDKKDICVVVESFLKDEEIIIDFSIEQIQKIESSEDNEIYKKYDQMFKYFQSFPLMCLDDLEAIKTNYITAILFSIYVGNTDLHVHNINLLYNDKTKKYRFTPIYDQNSALDLKNILEESIIFAGYPKGKTSEILDCLFTKYKMYCKIFIDKLQNYCGASNILNKYLLPIVIKKGNLLDFLEKRKKFILAKFSNNI